MSRVAVIGGGPAGIMAAAAAAGCGHDSVLLEKNEKLGKKLFLTGKGRCNITNSCDTDDFFANIPRNPKFLYSALYGFSNTDIVELINANGVPTKAERGKRVFPASDKSSDIIKALTRHLNNSGAELRLNTEVSGDTLYRRRELPDDGLDRRRLCLCKKAWPYRDGYTPVSHTAGYGRRVAREIGWAFA